LGPSATPQTVVLDSPVPAPDGDIPARNTYYVGGVVFDSSAAGTRSRAASRLIIDTTAGKRHRPGRPERQHQRLEWQPHDLGAAAVESHDQCEHRRGQQLEREGNQTAQAGAGIIKSGAGNLEMKHARVASLNVSAGTLKITSSGGWPSGASKVGALSIGASARLDLRDNKLITTTPVGTFGGGVYNGVQGEIQRAYNFGSWDQPGLMTSETNAGPTVGTTTLGVSDGASILFLGPTETGTGLGKPSPGEHAGDVHVRRRREF
jgi:hypothetical protein